MPRFVPDSFCVVRLVSFSFCAVSVFSFSGAWMIDCEFSVWAVLDEAESAPLPGQKQTTKEEKLSVKFSSAWQQPKTGGYDANFHV